VVCLVWFIIRLVIFFWFGCLSGLLSGLVVRSFGFVCFNLVVLVDWLVCLVSFRLFG
jgi:hypothetical protein